MGAQHSEFMSSEVLNSVAKLRPRRERGSLKVEQRRWGPVWIGRWRADIMAKDGTIQRICRTKNLGELKDIPTRASAEQILSEEITRSILKGRVDIVPLTVRQPVAQSPAQLLKLRIKKLSKYGLTEADYDEMFSAQLGVCAICRKHPLRGGLVVDHNHSTTKVRALLCGHCNTGLGMFKENPALLIAAVEYLKCHTI